MQEVWVKVKAWFKKWWWIPLGILALVGLVFFFVVSGDTRRVANMYNKILAKMRKAEVEKDQELADLARQKDEALQDSEEVKDNRLKEISNKYQKELKTLEKENESRYAELSGDPDALLDALNKHLGNR